MQNQYFVKGLGFGQKQDILETRSYNRIRKIPYSAYNNRSYNLNYRDVRQINEKLKRIVAVLNKAVKNQAVTMFKYLSIYVQNKQSEETKAQLQVIQEGLFKFQHAVSLFRSRQKVIVLFRLAKVDVVTHLKKELGYSSNLQKNQPITHVIFRKWLQLTLDQKCNRLLRQQQVNKINFYKFVLLKLKQKQNRIVINAFNKIRTSNNKTKINKMVENLSFLSIRLKIDDPSSACYNYQRESSNLDKIIAFYRIRQYHYFNPSHHHIFLTLHNIINSKLNYMKSNVLQTLIMNQISCRGYKTMRIPKQLIQNIQIEIDNSIIHCQNEHILKKERGNSNQSTSAIYLLNCTLKTSVNMNCKFAFIKIKNYHPTQDNEVQNDIIKNMSIISAKMAQKIKQKNQLSNLHDRKFKLQQLFKKNIFAEQKTLKLIIKKWQNQITFEPKLFSDFEMRIQIMQNEKEVIMTDIEQLELMNNDLFLSVDQVKKTFISEDSHVNKQEHQEIAETNNFEIQDQQVISQEDLKIEFEYVSYLKELNVDLQQKYSQNELLMKEELQKMQEELKELESRLN